MRIIKPTVIVEDGIDGHAILRKLEMAGRTCYKSEDRITDESAAKFVAKLIEHGHHAMIEHANITCTFICDRGVTHEIVRHRIASYAQESTRYCNYSKDKFGNELTFIEPCFWPDKTIPGCNDQLRFAAWCDSMRQAEHKYMYLVSVGASPQEARSVLPNSLKTEIVVTMNIREWRHFFALRCSPQAHPQMREVAKMALDKLRALVPVVFDDIPY